MQKSVFKALDPVNSHEIELILKRVKKMDGIHSVDFNVNDEELTVVHEDISGFPKKINNSIIAIGYTFQPIL